jgi:hypothetical protein
MEISELILFFSDQDVRPTKKKKTRRPTAYVTET